MNLKVRSRPRASKSILPAGQVGPAARVQRVRRPGRPVGAVPGQGRSRPHADLDHRRLQRHRLSAAAAAGQEERRRREPEPRKDA